MAKGRGSRGNSGQRSKTLAGMVAPGVRLLQTLEGHRGDVTGVAFSPDGRWLASASGDHTVRLWEASSGRELQHFTGHEKSVRSVSFSPDGRWLASSSDDHTVRLWEASSGRELRQFAPHEGTAVSVSFSPDGRWLASGSTDKTVRLWEVASGMPVQILTGHRGEVYSVSFDPLGQILASGSHDSTVILWDAANGKQVRTLEANGSFVNSVSFDPSGGTLAGGIHDKMVILWNWADGKLLRSLEGHTELIDRVEFSRDGRFLASMSLDNTIRVWRCDTWEVVAVIPMRGPDYWVSALAFHPTLPLLAAPGSAPHASKVERGRLIHIWELDLDASLGRPAGVAPARRAVHHTTGKIVLVGDHSVGKSALGYRMIHGQFKEQASTHGQQFWVFPALGKRRTDGTECEAILWDFAGQPDYRLVHALFVDDADLALVLFDASDIHDPLHGVGFWLKQLQAGRSRCPIILVGAQADRGSCTLTPQELTAFCQKHAVAGPVHTSALTGIGVAELVERMKAMFPWDDKPATVTTRTFKRIKDYVLGLKEARTETQSIVTPDELRHRLEATDADWRFTDAEMLTAVGHLENYGYVRRLRTSKGEERVLLAPELLNNLASSFVLEARRHQKGLGSLEEKRLLNGGYPFQELARLTGAEQATLLDAAALLFLEHNVCFRETDPLRMEPYLVFPDLINLKKPAEEEEATEDGAAYTVTGPTENVFASLVVLLGYTHTFTRTNQWQNNARYEVGEGLVCGFRQEGERDGELDFVLCFCPRVGQSVRTLFQGLFESFLARRNLTVMRYDPIRCTNAECGHLLDRSVVRQRMKEGKSFACCNECGERLTLPKMAESIQLTREVKAEVETQRRAAEQRTHFEQAIYRVQTYVAQKKIGVPECFISYAWGVPEHERWVEKRLATDLQKAGIDVILDRWENARVGASVSRFVERIAKSSHVVVVGTPFYLEKYENKNPERGYVVAAEFDVISNRLLGTEAQKESVLPVLLTGEKVTSFPALLHDRVHADFRKDEGYFLAAFDLILSLYGIPPHDLAVADLRESLCEPRIR